VGVAAAVDVRIAMVTLGDCRSGGGGSVRSMEEAIVLRYDGWWEFCSERWIHFSLGEKNENGTAWFAVLVVWRL